MPYSRELLGSERLDVAHVLAAECSDGGVPVADVLARLDMAPGKFNLQQTPNAVWMDIVKAVHAGVHGRLGWGCDAVVFLLEEVTATFLPGNIRLLKLARRLGEERKRGPGGVGGGPAGGAGGGLFLSYSRLDRADVDRLYEALKAERPGLTIYQDHRMPAGTVWFDTIFDAATGAAGMVCWTTEAYLKSTFCAFEMGLATTAGVRLMPVFVPPEVKTAMPAAYVSRWQGMDIPMLPDLQIDFRAAARAVVAALDHRQ